MNNTNTTFHSEKMNDEDQILNVFPISKGKRILVYLADMLLNFVLSLFLFSTAVFPIARGVLDYQGKVDTMTINHQRMLDTLYENNLLSFQEEKSRYDFDTSFDYSAQLFVLDLLQEKEEHLFPLTYFVSLKGMDKELAIQEIKKYDTSGFFAEEGFVLKTNYVEEFLPLLDDKDTLTNQGRDDLLKFKSGSISSMYAFMIHDIQGEDSALSSYRSYYLENEELSKKNDDIIIFSSLIAYLVSCLLYFLLIPLLSKNGSTFGMIALKCIRIDVKNFDIIPKWNRLAFFISYLVTSLPTIMFVPMMFVAFYRLFSLGALFYMSLLTLALVIVSLFVVIFNPFGKSLSDILSRSIMIDNETYDNILEARIHKYE